MGTMSVSGLDDLIGDLDELARLPDSVTDQMLNAEADVIEAAQRSEASRMWKGPYYTGTTAASIKKNERKEQEAVAAGEKVYHAYLDGKKL